MSRTQINFRVSEEEKSRWEKAAAKSKLPLGTWIKNALEAAAAGAPQEITEPQFGPAHAGDDVGTGTPLPEDEQDLGEGEKPEREVRGHARHKAAAKTCKHGKPRGYHCGLCGGKAKVK